MAKSKVKEDMETMMESGKGDEKEPKKMKKGKHKLAKPNC